MEIDIKSRAGRDELLGLAADADVFVHNWAPGTAVRLGLDDRALRTANHGLVYAHTSGWAGRLENAPLGTDFMVQARTGVGEAVRPDGETPAPSLMTLLDVLGGLLGTEAVLAGLLTRACEGRGARVESSLLGAAEELTGPAVRRIAAGQPARRPPGFRCLYALFRAHRYADPDRLAVIDAQGTLTYAGLDRLARAAAAGLRRLGVCEGDVVGIQLPNGRDAVAAELAVAALGAVALPFPVGRGIAEAVSLLGRYARHLALALTIAVGNT